MPIYLSRQCFGLVLENPTCEGTAIPPNFQGLLSHLGYSIVDLFFMAEKGGVSWVEFLRGYVKCCGRMSASTSFNGLFRIFEMALAKAGIPDKLQFESDDDGGGKMSGFLMPADVLLLHWLSGVELNPWDCDILSMDVQLPAAKIHTWALKQCQAFRIAFQDMSMENSRYPLCQR
ncbi:TLD-domain containing nucleolar protein [Actinidia rufa]|uniref:TLD-domain containing nucleolar protein n=1 Tax=Actinidia rufa TaxID=165716 RepID=A0A7J0GHV7_9ERIC|nr:TLD-domain containing nucleolar protein [Actinidia rufa]